MRAAIFIDGGYILQQLRSQSFEPDWSGLADHLLAPLRRNIDFDLLRCYFYYCAPWMSASPTEEENRRMEVHNGFVQQIENFDRWEMRLGKLERRMNEKGQEYFEQKRVDVLLSVDLVRHAASGHIQHAILVAGDSDLIPAVAAAKESGVTLTLWCGSLNTVHKDLVLLADEVRQFRWKDFPKAKKAAAREREQKQPNRSRSRRSTGNTESSASDDTRSKPAKSGSARKRPSTKRKR